MNKKIINDIIEICDKVNLPATNDNECEKKIQVIKNLIDGKFKIKQFENFLLVEPDLINPKGKIKIVSSHIDNVYKKTFLLKNNKTLTGSFDNSITNAILVYYINHQKNNQICYVFTKHEEDTMKGITDVLNYFRNFRDKIFICLDVTPYCSYTHVGTIENNKFILIKRKFKKIAKIEWNKCMNDEARILGKMGEKSLSYNIAVKYEDNDCHHISGGTLSDMNLILYYKNLKKVIESF